MSNRGRPIEKQMRQETSHEISEIWACLLATKPWNSCSNQASLKPVLWPISQCNCQVAPAFLSLVFFSLPGFLWNRPKTRTTREAWVRGELWLPRHAKAAKADPRLDHSSYGKFCEDGMKGNQPCSDPLSCLTFCWSFHSHQCWWSWWQILPIAGRQLYCEALLNHVLVLAIFWDGWDRVPCATARICKNHICEPHEAWLITWWYTIMPGNSAFVLNLHNPHRQGKSCRMNNDQFVNGAVYGLNY